MDTPMTVIVRQLTPAVGAEISGVDLGEPFDPATFDAIHRAFLDHAVLVFRDQAIDEQQNLAFTRRFGELEAPFVRPRQDILAQLAQLALGKLHGLVMTTGENGLLTASFIPFSDGQQL